MTDRILLEVAGDGPVLTALDAHRVWVGEQVLAVEIRVLPEPAGDGWHRAPLAEQAPAAIRVTRMAAP